MLQTLGGIVFYSGKLEFICVGDASQQEPRPSVLRTSPYTIGSHPRRPAKFITRPTGRRGRRPLHYANGSNWNLAEQHKQNAPERFEALRGISTLQRTIYLILLLFSYNCPASDEGQQEVAAVNEYHNSCGKEHGLEYSAANQH